MRSIAVFLALSGAVVAGSTCAAADAGSFCVTVAGSCKMDAEAGPTCRCETLLGGIQGEPKPVGNFEMSLLPTALIGSMARIAPSDIDVQVFSKKADKAVVDEWLKSLDQKISRGYGNPNAALVNDDTNAIFFSEDAPKDAVRVAAIALIQKGLKIKSIQLYYPDPGRNLPVRHNLIQVGASSANRARNPLTTSQVATAALPMFGDLAAPP
jgi:hypothetical protein